MSQKVVFFAHVGMCNAAYILARATVGTSLYVSLHSFVLLFFFKRRRQTSCDVARLQLMSPMGLWPNSTPFFGAAAFCTTKIDRFRAQAIDHSVLFSLYQFIN